MELKLSDSADDQHALQSFADWCERNGHTVYRTKGSCNISRRFNWICHVQTNKAGSRRLVIRAIFFGKRIPWDKIEIYHGNMAILVKDFNRQQNIMKFTFDGSLIVEALRVPRKLSPAIFEDYLEEIEFTLNHLVFCYIDALKTVLEF